MYSTKLRVKELLRERRWTTKVLAEKTGMSESYLTHIKNGTRRWNEDALKKLAGAFELDPIEIFDHAKDRTDKIATDMEFPDSDEKEIKLDVKIVPVIGEIPAQPSAYNNQIAQKATGCTGQFVPVITKNGSGKDGMFCLRVDDNSMAPKFVKNDYLVIAPGEWTSSGDVVAVEYGNDEPIREIMQINFMEEFVVLEAVNHKRAPIALVRGKDNFRIIGKVISRYQMFS